MNRKMVERVLADAGLVVGEEDVITRQVDSEWVESLIIRLMRCDDAHYWCEHMLWSVETRFWYFQPAGFDAWATSRKTWKYCPMCAIEKPPVEE